MENEEIKNSATELNDDALENTVAYDQRSDGGLKSLIERHDISDIEEEKHGEC